MAGGGQGIGVELAVGGGGLQAAAAAATPESEDCGSGTLCDRRLGMSGIIIIGAALGSSGSSFGCTFGAAARPERK